jgi:hypothetical protein
MQDLSDDTIQRMSQLLTTEHFTLQGARNGTIAEANGRLGHYLSAVGSSVVALAFVVDVSGVGPAFIAFSAVLFPVLIFLGAMTLIRIVQIGLSDASLVKGINRIRHAYLEMVPEAEIYFSFPPYDDPDAVQDTMMPFHHPLQSFASTPGPVILINSVLTGAFASILATGLLSTPPVVTIIVGLVTLVLALVAHIAWNWRIWTRVARREREVRFPSPED